LQAPKAEPIVADEENPDVVPAPEQLQPISAKDANRPRRFKRTALLSELPKEIHKKFVEETTAFLTRRHNTLAINFDNINKTNFNPFLLLITAPVYNIFSPFEVAERLQLGKAFHGDDTAFGRMAEEKYLGLFGAVTPPEKKKEKAAWTPIDLDVTIEGQRYLLSVKSGPWTMNQEHANAMIDRFPDIHKQTGAKIILGITYGRYASLNNKPGLVDRSLGNPDWFDFLVGRDFWEFVTGVSNVHKHIFLAIREAQKAFGAKHFDETFHEKLVSNRLKIASSLRKQFNVEDEEDFWETLFNNAFDDDADAFLDK
jgi:hypothetical protein